MTFPAQIIDTKQPQYKLDEKDKKILAVLATNSRTPTTTIGQITRLSQENVYYRLKKLQEENIIVDYFTTFDIQKLEIMQFAIFIKFQTITKEEHQHFLQSLLTNPNISWVSTTAGQFDVALFLQAGTIIQFESYWRDIYEQFGQFFRECSIGIMTEFSHCPPLYPIQDIHLFYDTIQEKRLPYQSSQSVSESLVLDKKGIDIILALKDNSRITLTNLGKQVKMSSQNVNYRLKQLVQARIIKTFYYRPNYHRLGYQYYTLRIKLSHPNTTNTKKITNYFMACPKIFVYFRMIGQWDITVHIFFRDSRELNDFIFNLREQFGNIIESIDTTIHMDQYFFSYFSKNMVKFLKEKYK